MGLFACDWDFCAAITCVSCAILTGARCGYAFTSLLCDRYFLPLWQLHHLHAKDASQLHLRCIEHLFELLAACISQHLLADVCTSDRSPLVFAGEREPNHLLDQLLEISILSSVVSVAIIFIFGTEASTLRGRFWRGHGRCGCV